MWFDDLIGAFVAAIAMGIACATIIFAQTATRTTRYTFVFCVIMILGYVVKVCVRVLESRVQTCWSLRAAQRFRNSAQLQCTALCSVRTYRL